MIVFWKAIRITVGVILCLAGIVLGPVPIIPGFVVFAFGLALLARDVPWVKHKVDALLARWRRFREERLGKKQKSERTSSKGAAGDS